MLVTVPVTTSGVGFAPKMYFSACLRISCRRQCHGGLRRHARPVQLQERIGQLGDLREPRRVRQRADDAVGAFIFDAGLAGARAAAGTGRARRAGRSCGSCCSCGSAHSGPYRLRRPRLRPPCLPRRRCPPPSRPTIRRCRRCRRAGAAAGSGAAPPVPAVAPAVPVVAPPDPELPLVPALAAPEPEPPPVPAVAPPAPEPPPAPALLPPVAVSPVVESGDTQPIATPTHTHSRKTGPAFIGLIRAPIPACRPS